MKEIKLFNRDGADLWLKCTYEEIEPNIFIWALTVDPKHSFVLEHCRVIYNKGFDSDIIAIDPSGGPMINLGDEFENKYKIVKINSVKSIWISERNNN